MILKWIKCTVPIQSRDAFSKAQEGWIDVQNSKGFIRQMGGWHKKKKNLAHIFALWETIEDLEHFMKHDHDIIYHNSGQKETYASSIIDIQEGNVDYLNWFIERQKIKYVKEWLI